MTHIRAPGGSNHRPKPAMLKTPPPTYLIQMGLFVVIKMEQTKPAEYREGELFYLPAVFNFHSSSSHNRLLEVYGLVRFHFRVKFCVSCVTQQVCLQEQKLSMVILYRVKGTYVWRAAVIYYSRMRHVLGNAHEKALSPNYTALVLLQWFKDSEFHELFSSLWSAESNLHPVSFSAESSAPCCWSLSQHCDAGETNLLLPL